MRDYFVATIIFSVLPFTLFRPDLGILLWTWVGLMTPHRLGWGFAYSFPFAMLVAVFALVGILMSSEPKRLPLRPPVVALLAFIVWMSVTSVFAFNQSSAWDAWEQVIKIQLFILLTLMVMGSRDRLRALVWVSTLSIAFFGFKGGIYTIMGGGTGMVLGPPGTFIEGNTEISLAMTMSLPLLRYLQLTTARQWLRWGLGLTMVLCAIAILGSYSRGGLLAIAAMAVFFLGKNRKKLAVGLALLLLVPSFLLFMPDQWYEKMATIGTYHRDASALGRINAWYFAVNLAMDHPLVGGGFRAFTRESFLQYAPDPLDFHDSHSIWFQVLGEQGFVGLALFASMWLLAWRSARRVIAIARDDERQLWAGDLMRMIQVSLVGYWVGGSFLGLAYWDYPYVLLAMIVLAELIVLREVGLARAGSLDQSLPESVEGDAAPAMIAGAALALAADADRNGSTEPAPEDAARDGPAFDSSGEATEIDLQATADSAATEDLGADSGEIDPARPRRAQDGLSAETGPGSEGPGTQSAIATAAQGDGEAIEETTLADGPSSRAGT